MLMLKSKILIRVVAAVTLVVLPTVSLADDWSLAQGIAEKGQKVQVTTIDGKLLKGAIADWRESGILLQGAPKPLERKDVSRVTTGMNTKTRALIGFGIGFGIGMAVGSGAGNPKSPAKKGLVLGTVLGGAGAGMMALTGGQVVLFSK